MPYRFFQCTTCNITNTMTITQMTMPNVTCTESLVASVFNSLVFNLNVENTNNKNERVLVKTVGDN